MIDILREHQLPEHEVELGSHHLVFEENAYECKHCELGARIPEIAIRNGPDTAEVYLYYILGALYHFSCDSGINSSGNGSTVTLYQMQGGRVDDSTTSGGPIWRGDGRIQMQLTDDEVANLKEIHKKIAIEKKQAELRQKMGIN